MNHLKVTKVLLMRLCPEATASEVDAILDIIEKQSIQTLQGQGNPGPAAIDEAAALLSVPSAASAFGIVTEDVDVQKYAPLRAVFLSLLDDFRRGKFR